MDSSTFKRNFDLGEDSYKTGNYEEAIKHFQVAKFFAQNDLEIAKAFNKMAWCWRYLGFKKTKDTSECYKKANFYWKKCLQLIPYSVEEKVSVVKGLMLIVSTKEAKSLYEKYRKDFLLIGKTDLILALDNSWALRVRDESPEEAYKLFEFIYDRAREHEDFVLAGHAAQNAGVIAMRCYRDKSDLTARYDSDRLNVAETWLLKALLVYPNFEDKCIKDTIEKLNNIIVEGRENNTIQAIELCVDTFSSGKDTCTHVTSEKDCDSGNIPDYIGMVVFRFCLTCDMADKYVIFNERLFGGTD